MWIVDRKIKCKKCKNIEDCWLKNKNVGCRPKNKNVDCRSKKNVVNVNLKTIMMDVKQGESWKVGNEAFIW